MPDRSDKYKELEANDDPLPFISKSRLMEWVKNPEHFRLKYIEGYRGKGTEATDRGTRIHETIEHYYERAEETYEETGLPPGDLVSYLPDDRSMWADFIEPHISNFFRFEHSRIECSPSVEAWVPVSQEEEHWRDDLSVPWEGTVDAVFKAASVPQIDSDEGYVIIDWKTGRYPKEKYRDEGIYMELEFYRLLFSDKYQPLHVGAFYTKPGELIIPPDDRRTSLVDEILESTTEMERHVNNYDDYEHFPTNPGPLCGWGADDPDCRSELYGICPCTWNVPADNQETFKELVDRGLPMSAIAERMGTTTDAVSYWKYKMNL